MLITSRKFLIPTIFTALFFISPSLTLAQDAVPTAPAVQEAAPQGDHKTLLQKAKEKAAVAAEKATESARAVKEETIKAAKVVAEKASDVAAAAKVKANAVAEKTREAATAAKVKIREAATAAKEKASEAASAAKEKASEAASAAKEVGQKAIDTSAKIVQKAKAKLMGNEKTDSSAKPALITSKPKVKFKTNLGEFIVELNPEKAPITVKNFMGYVDAGFYSNTIFHRVISSFMIQGGGFTSDMNKKATNAPIVLESKNGLSNVRGTIAMARTGNPNSATSQFFINVVHNRNLDNFGGGYAVFGEVISGLKVIDKIRAVKTASKSRHKDVPVDTVVIESATRL
jgi:cyclophilin family peptidyl-prolyl cis-trans isomerase